MSKRKKSVAETGEQPTIKRYANVEREGNLKEEELIDQAKMLVVQLRATGSHIIAAGIESTLRDAGKYNGYANEYNNNVSELQKAEEFQKSCTTSSCVTPSSNSNEQHTRKIFSSDPKLLTTPQRKEKSKNASVSQKTENSQITHVTPVVQEKQSKTNIEPQKHILHSNVVENSNRRKLNFGQPSTSSLQIVEDDVRKVENTKEKQNTVENSVILSSHAHVADTNCKIPSRQQKSDYSEGMAINVIIHPPTYRLFADYSYQKKRYMNYLIVFTNPEQTLCYKYFHSPSRACYTCVGCDRLPAKNGKINITAQFGEKNGKEYVKLLRTCHHCQPFLFSTIVENAGRVVKKPNFEITEADNGKKYLFIYSDDANDYKGYSFYQKETRYCCSGSDCWVRADEVTLEDGDAGIRLNGEHVCQKSSQQPLSANARYSKIVRLPNYVKCNSRIFLFSNPGSNMGYNYSINLQDYCYCLNCMKLGQYIGVKLDTDGKGEHLKISERKHVCKTIQYAPDFDKLYFTPLKCPKEGEGVKEVKKLEEYLNEDDDDEVRAHCYTVTVAGPDAPIEERYSGVAYFGYTENIEMRLPDHWRIRSKVGKLIEKHGVVYLVPIYHSSSRRCFNLEATGIQLRREGSLDFHLLNERRGEWKSNKLKSICECRENPEHEEIAIAFKRMVYDALQKTENFISSHTFIFNTA